MKNLTSLNEPLQANKAEEGSRGLEADQRILCISIISITYTQAEATVTTTTLALCVYSWTLMHRSHHAAPSLLHQLLPSPHMPRPRVHSDMLLTMSWPICLQQGEAQEQESLHSRHVCSFALLTTQCDGRWVCFLLQTSPGGEIPARGA